jgi:hypothetical protein
MYVETMVQEALGDRSRTEKFIEWKAGQLCEKILSITKKSMKKLKIYCENPCCFL